MAAVWLNWNYTFPCQKASVLWNVFSSSKIMFSFRIIQFYFSGCRSWWFCLSILYFSVGAGFVLKVVNMEAPLADYLKKCESLHRLQYTLEGDRSALCFCISTALAECESRLTLGGMTVRWHGPAFLVCCDPLACAVTVPDLLLRTLSAFEAHGWGPLKSIFINADKTSFHVQS